MSLTSGLHNPRTPLRLFLDRELSAGPKPLRESFRIQHRADDVLLPGPGVGTEAGTVGTAIDQRLRLAFTAAAPVDQATLIGIELTGGLTLGPGLQMRAVGNELAARLTETVHRLELDNRQAPIERAHDEEEDLARLLLAAAWYQVLARTSIGFAFTPLARTAWKDPGDFTLARLLELPHRDLVADVVAQLYRAADGPLAALRTRTRPQDCIGGPTFEGVDLAADADLVVDGLLLDFKSTKHPGHLEKRTAWQLLGYLLLDTPDRYRIDALGLYLTRSGVLASWPVDEYLDLLGTCRRDLPTLRALLAELIAGCPADIVPHSQKDEDRARRLLRRLAPAIAPGHCLVCAQALPDAGRRARDFCSHWCSVRGQTLRKKGQLPTRTAVPLPHPRKEPAEPPEAIEPRPRSEAPPGSSWPRSARANDSRLASSPGV
ncbi:hypothetical protein ABZ553_40090 [Streptomyces sparsogenes]|uniref:hypothetical protein n=1 Tax=Streptomyces sparsogenes TaxID=67365 RepID=UPI0033D62E43